MLKSRDAPSCTCGERSGAGAPENLLVLSPVQFILQRAVTLTDSSRARRYQQSHSSMSCAEGPGQAVSAHVSTLSYEKRLHTLARPIWHSCLPGLLWAPKCWVT